MKHSEPLFRVAKREGGGWQRMALAYLLAIAAALGIGAILLITQEVNPLTFYKNMFSIGVLGNRFAYKSVEGFIQLFVPLLITSVALSLAFRMRFWNIGGEGQFIVGALCAGAIGFKLGNTLPNVLVILLMAIVAMLGAGLYGTSVAVLKVRYNTNETLMTLMLNYIALYLLRFFAETKAPWNFFLSVESERPLFEKLPDGAKMPLIKTGLGGGFALNTSLIVAALICVGVYIYLNYTKQGYEIAVVGDSASTARYAGMKVNRIVIRTIFLSAALIGLSGAFYAASAGKLSTSMTNNVGFTGIIVAWLSKLNTIAIVVVTVFITVLQYGCQVASTSYPRVDANFANLIQGVMLFAVLMADFFTRFQLVWRTGKQEVAK